MRQEFSVTTNEIYFTEGADYYTLYRYNLSNKKVEKITDEKMKDNLSQVKYRVNGIY